MTDDSCFSTCIRKHVKDYFYFSKAVFFTFGLFFSHAAVEYAFFGYMFVLIRGTTNLKIAALISNLLECLSPFLDSFTVRPGFRQTPYLITNLITGASFIAGILMPWIKAPPWSAGIIYPALTLLAVGSTAERFAYSFLYSYIRSEDDDVKVVRRDFVRTDVWRSLARCAGAISGLKISEFKIESALKISGIVTIISYVFLLCGIMFYKCQKNERNPVPQEINQSSPKGSLMQLLKLLLLYMPFLIYYVVEGAGNTLFYEQVVEKLDDPIKNIPFGSAACLYATQKASGLLTSLLMEILIIPKLWKESEQWQCSKLILGMFVCFCCCMCSWYVEHRRLSNLWTLVPQFVLLGIAKELVEDGMEDIFFSLLKRSMYIWFSAFFSFVNGLGALLGAVFIAVFGKWIRGNIDESRLDKYYLLLAMLTILAILCFMGLWKFYAPKIKQKKDDDRGIPIISWCLWWKRKARSFGLS